MNKQRTLVELVPKNESEIQDSIKYMQENFTFDGINLPHLKQRWNVAFMTPEEIWLINLPENLKLISHLRTQDSKDELEVVNRVNKLLKLRADEILLVTWDALSEKNDIITTWKVLNNTPKNNLPDNISVSADLYMENWWRFNDKMDFLKDRNEANIYTQPVFSNNTILEILKQKDKLELKQDLSNIHIWITFITTLESRNYWEKVNNIPSNLLPKWEFEWKIRENSISIARDIFTTNKSLWFSTYIMLIKCKIDILLELENKINNLSEI